MTQVGVVILITALVAILLLGVFFIVCRKYEEGVIGNLAICGMVFACGLILWDAWRKELEIPPPAYCLLIVCAAVFIFRHGWRFAMFHWADVLGWKKPRDHDADETIPFPFGRVR